MSILKIKDSQGNWVGVPTVKGDTGNGISSAVLNDDYTLTLTFTDGTTYTTPSIRGEKGEQGEPATDMDIHICSASEYDSETRIPTIANPNDKTFYLVPTEDGTSPDLFTEWVYVNGAWEMFGSMKIDLSDYLTDVQINGTSIVSDGVANVPIASGTALGAVRYASGYGATVNAEGFINIAPATINLIKSPSVISASRMPITPSHQHESTFYGLAKAAGDTTQSQSSNTVGNYTDEAKSSIQNMLGITDKYSPKDWVAESETELVTNAHSVGDLFYIGETLYKVIADLNAGDAVNVGVNVEEVNANDILDDYATKEDVQDNISIVEKSASGAVASFSDGADDIPLKSLVVDINPIQDLHGQDAPYPAGGGKNKLPLTVDGIKALNPNTRGTWTGNSYTYLGITYTPVTDSDGNVIKIHVSGTKMGASYFDLAKINSIPYGTYILNGGASGINVRAYHFDGTHIASSNSAAGTQFTSTEDAGNNTFDIVVATDIEVNADVYPMVRLTSETDATFAPYENICPISGWTSVGVNQFAVNVWDEEWEVGNYNSGTGEKQVNNNQIRSKNFIPVKPNTSLYFNTRTNSRVLYYKTDCTYIGSELVNSDVFVTPDNCYFINFHLGVAYGTTYNHDISINYPSTDHSYHPYTGRSITIDLGQTVYGGKLDVLTGVMRVEWASKTTTFSEGWGTVIGTYKRVSIAINPVADVDRRHLTLCNLSGTYKNAFSEDSDHFYITTSGGTGYCFVPVGTSGELQFVYPLAEPIEIQLTPQQVNSLLGVNNIFANTGNTSVEYFSQVDKDLIDYIKASLKPYAKEEKLNDYVNDVQIDGTSIVTDGVANVPIAGNNAGVIKVATNYGTNINPNGVLYIYESGLREIKGGTQAYRSITPQHQHESTFYGLAKAAGDTTQSQSSNAVGTYTDEAKTAIKQMLGVHDTIDSFVEEVTGTDVTIIGQPSYRYNCGELYSLTVTPPSSGTIDFRFTSGSTPTVLTLPSTVKMPEWWVEVEANTIYEMCITDGIYCGVMTWAI